ncbi:MAG: hypothetical protein Q8922_00325 [Bacteroidota bacterium]|nr:hypothetical protein [Bacteroidota bacterium]MDP4232478.1 hypothetical protein [Bacteroidota bacterium]MDP4241613.1 hypothetical protein [Bacteroidota bacterium]MDP4286358.1 hypothetical protein [Bacteroidota bacterium]
MKKLTAPPPTLPKSGSARPDEPIIRVPRRPKATTVSSSECLTALPATIDVAALAQLYNSPPASHVARADLLQQARTALMKYELAEADLELASDSLARAMHLLLEQHGIKELLPEHMAELERHVLNWYGLRAPRTVITDDATVAATAAQPEAGTLSELTIRRPETGIPGRHTHNAHNARETTIHN